MKSERIAEMYRNAISIDTETALIVPGNLAPKLILGSAAECSDAPLSGPEPLTGTGLDKRGVRHVFRAILSDPKWTVVVANGPFDFLVMAVDAAANGVDIIPDIFNMYDPEGTIVQGYCDGRVFDVQRAEELNAIADGYLRKNPRTGDRLKHPVTGEEAGYSLDIVTWLVQNRIDAKVNDRFRLRFAEFDDVPLDQLPFEARQYIVDDAINTLGNGLAQAGHLPSVNSHRWEPRNGSEVCAACGITLTPESADICIRLERRRNLHDLARQTYAHWALHLSDSWGFNVNQDKVDHLEATFDERRERLIQPFIKNGIVRENGTENQSVLKKLIAVAYGARSHCPVCANTGKVDNVTPSGKKSRINCKACDASGFQLPPTVPRTKTDGIGTSADVLSESGDDVLMGYNELGEGDKIKSTYIPLMRKARVCAYCNQQVGARIKKKNVTHAIECPVLDGAPVKWNNVALNTRAHTLVETGRCSYSDGIHGLPRKGGVRECFEARKGYVLSSEDFSAGELVMHSQNCIWLVGYSKMADALNNGIDAHVAIAATMLGINYETAMKLYKAHDSSMTGGRQGGKAGNFGYLGGMAELTFTLRKRADPDIFTPCENGPDTSPKGVRGYRGLRSCILLDGAERCGIDKITEYKGKSCAPVCEQCVLANKRIREAFFRQWPENNQKDGYFAVINDWLEVGQGKLVRNPNGPRIELARTKPGEIVHHKSLRIRGDVGFTDGANGLFQGMLADVMKNAYCQIQRECYDRTWRVRNSEHMASAYADAQSPLFGSRGMLLAHDEFIGEHPESVAHDAATRVAEIMIEAERFMAPDLSRACKVQPTLMRALYKAAEPVYENGRLVPWEPS